jgi:vacuolar protein sorting-associated protein 54
VELSSKSISELLRIRKDAHSLVTLDEMKKIWDTCVAFTQQIETLSGHKAVALRSTLMAQAKAFVERKHESNMSALVAALDSERWTQCEVSAERQAALTRLCSGRAVLSSTLTRDNGVGNAEKRPDAEVEGIRYKTVWSCLLLLEMVMSNIAAAAHFQSLASNVISKISELLRLFNSRTTHLVLGAGAIHATARLKSINAKHLSLVTQCLGMTIATMPHVRAALMAQMPQRQHTLLSSLDQIKKELADHNEKVLNKFVTIIGGIVEHGLAPKIAGTNFDLRAKANPPVDGVVPCCIFLEGVSTNTRKMHQVLSSLLPPDHLQDVFSRIFAFVDQTVPSLLVSTSENASPAKVTPKKGTSASPSNAGTKATIPSFSLPKTEEGKERLLIEVGIMTEKLNGLDGVQPWDFTAVNVLERKLEYRLETGTTETTTEACVTTEPGEGEQNNASTSDDALGSLPADGKETVVEEQEALFSVENESSVEGEQTDTVTLDVEPGTASADGYETAAEEQEAPVSIENGPSREGEQTDYVTRDTADANETSVEEQEAPVSIENKPPSEGEQTDSVTRDTADANETALDEHEARVSIENGPCGEGEQTDFVTPDAASGTAPADENETVDEEQEAPAPVENGPSGEGEETDALTRDTADGEETVDGEQETSASVENGSSGESHVPSEATHL